MTDAAGSFEQDHRGTGITPFVGHPTTEELPIYYLLKVTSQTNKAILEWYVRVNLETNV